MDETAFAELSAGHAVGALSAADEQTYAEALAAHPEWRAIAEDDLATAALLADAATPVEPPADIRAALLQQIGADASGDAVRAGTPEPARDPEPGPAAEPAPAHRRWTRAAVALAASVALIVAVGWGVGNLLAEPGPVTALAEIRAASDAQTAEGPSPGGGEAVLHWSESVGKVVLVVDGLPDIPDDRTFELWYVRGETPISAGTFDVDGHTATALLAGALEPGDTVAVTVEAAGGSPTGAPTTMPILAVPTS